MGATGGGVTPVVETKPTGDDEPDVTLRVLHQRIRQQEILSELGVTALQGASFHQLLTETARLTAEGLRVEFCKILEYMPADNRLLVRAGVGWDEGIIGVATVGADLMSPAGYALHTGKPVISNHLENEQRFRTSDLLEQHGIRRAMNVILQGDGRPYGVLEVDSRSEDEFVENDIAFLQGAANLLGMAIERERQARQLKAALERHELLLKEMNHRVKNSLSIVASMLNLQAREVANDELTAHLMEASNRVAAIAKAHDQLSNNSEVERMDLGKFVKAVCSDLDESVAHCDVHADTVEGILVPTDRAISIALITNELIANAVKYGYPDRQQGRIFVALGLGDAHTVEISVRDEGKGVPPDFDLGKPKGLGMRLIAAFAQQLDATITVQSQAPGTQFKLAIPLSALG